MDENTAAAEVVVAAVVAVVVVVVSLGMIICVHIVGFSCFMKRSNGLTYGWTEGQILLYSLYRDARTHLKM